MSENGEGSEEHRLPDERKRANTSREEWLSFLDMLIGLRSESMNRSAMYYWIVLPLLATVGWGILQFAHSTKVNTETFAISLLFLSLVSLSACFCIFALFTPPKDVETPRIEDEKLNERYHRMGITVGIYNYAIIIFAIVLLWKGFENEYTYILVGYLTLEIALQLISAWHAGLREKTRKMITLALSKTASRLIAAFISFILPILAILVLGWDYLHRETWFLPAILAVLEGGIVLGIFALWFFSLENSRRRGVLQKLVFVRYLITKENLTSEQIVEMFDSKGTILSLAASATE